MERVNQAHGDREPARRRPRLSLPCALFDEGFKYSMTCHSVAPWMNGIAKYCNGPSAPAAWIGTMCV
jgi:hypothetical protein